MVASGSVQIDTSAVFLLVIVTLVTILSFSVERPAVATNAVDER